MGCSPLLVYHGIVGFFFIYSQCYNYEIKVRQRAILMTCLVNKVFLIISFSKSTKVGSVSRVTVSRVEINLSVS